MSSNWALAQVIAWCDTGVKSLLDPILIHIYDAISSQETTMSKITNMFRVSKLVLW